MSSSRRERASPASSGVPQWRCMPTTRRATVAVVMRLAGLLVVVLTTIACTSGNDPAPPVPLDQRFPTAEDAPGSRPDPDEQGQTTSDFDEFIAELTHAVIDPDEAEMTTVFEQAGFSRAGLDVRFFGETHASSAPHLFSWFIDLESEDGVTSALDWLATDATKPCPMSCATQVSEFSVDGIPGVRGVHRLRRPRPSRMRARKSNSRPTATGWGSPSALRYTRSN